MVKLLIFLQGSRLIYVPGHLIRGGFFPYKAISFIHKKKNKEGEEGGKEQSKYEEILYFLSLEWILKCDLLSLLYWTWLLSLSAAVTTGVIQEYALLTDWGGFRE